MRFLSKSMALIKELEALIETLDYNTKLPSERVLATKYQVSRMTVRRALESLKEEKNFTSCRM